MNGASDLPYEARRNPALPWGYWIVTVGCRPPCLERDCRVDGRSFEWSGKDGR